MKKFRFISGFVAGLVIGTTVIVGANQAIQAIQNTQVKIKLDGKIQNFKDESTGEVQYPITYNDRTYLPLRNVANLAGLNVDYDADNNTAILNSKEYEKANNKYKEYDTLVKKNEKNRFRNSFSGMDISREGDKINISASYFGDTKVDTKIVEDAYKAAKDAGKSSFYLSINNIRVSFYVTAPKNSVNENVSKLYSSYYISNSMGYFLAKESDGYYFKYLDVDTAYDVQTVQEKNVLNFEFNGSDKVYYNLIDDTGSSPVNILVCGNLSAILDLISRDSYVYLTLEFRDNQIYFCFESVNPYIFVNGSKLYVSPLTNRAQLAMFMNNFSQYYDRFIMDSLNKKQVLGIHSEVASDSQLYYMTANGIKSTNDDVEVYNRMLPVGYVLPDTLKDIYRVSNNDVVAYIIDDKNITGYGTVPNNLDGSAGYEFYGDENGDEYHFVTSDGHAFTLPGFALPLEDGTIQYYISNEKGAYYVATGDSNLKVGDKNLNGDIIKEEGPILPNEIMKGRLHGLTNNEVPISKYGDTTTGASADQPSLENVVGTKEGRYTTLENNK